MSKEIIPIKGTERPLAAHNTDELIAAMQEEDAAAEREKILQRMTPECRKKLEYFDTWLRNEVNHSLRSRYDLGLQVKELYEDEKKGGKLYGKNAIGRICKILRWDDGLIRCALRFVQTYSAEELEHLCTSRLPNGQPLTWSHVRVLIPVEGKERRKELLERTMAKGWSCTELAQEMKKVMDGTVHDGRGRPPREPKDFDSAVAQQQESSEAWDRRYSKVWNTRDRSLVAQAAKLTPEEITEERLHQARQLAIQLRRVATEASEQAEKAEMVVRDFERILEERKQAESPSEPTATPQRNSLSKQPRQVVESKGK